MWTKGDKAILVKQFDNYIAKIDSTCEIVDVNEFNVITFKFDNEERFWCIATDLFEKHFKKYEEPKPISVDPDYVEKIMSDSKFITSSVFNKCTIVACQLPNGFVMVESSSCVDNRSYDEKMGVEICMNKFKEKIYEMEAYKLQHEMYEKDKLRNEEDFYDEEDDDYYDYDDWHNIE